MNKERHTHGEYLYINMSASEFSQFVEICEKVRQTASKNVKVNTIAEYLIKFKDKNNNNSDNDIAGQRQQTVGGK